MITTVEKLLALLRVILLAAPAANVVVPVTLRLPLSVIAPFAVTERVPLTVEVPKSTPAALLRITLFPLVTLTVEARLLTLSRVILFTAPAANVVAPVTAKTPLSVITPFAVTERAPFTVDAPKIMPSKSLRLTLFPLVTATVENLLLALSRVMLLAPATRVVMPVTSKAPLCVTAPPAVRPKVPVIVEAPKIMAPASLKSTFPPLVTTTVEKLLAALFRVILLAPAAKVVVPVTAKAPLWVTSPWAVNPRVPLMVEAPKTIADELFNSTLEPLVMLTAPPKVLSPVSEILEAPATKVVVEAPAIVKTPLVIFPVPAVVTKKFPVVLMVPKMRPPTLSVKVTAAPFTFTAP